MCGPSIGVDLTWLCALSLTPMHLATQSAWGTTPFQYAGLEKDPVIVWGKSRSAGNGPMYGVQNAEGCFLWRMYLVELGPVLIWSVFPVMKVSEVTCGQTSAAAVIPVPAWIILRE